LVKVKGFGMWLKIYWKGKDDGKNGFINSKFRNMGCAWKVRMMGRVKWM